MSPRFAREGAHSPPLVDYLCRTPPPPPLPEFLYLPLSANCKMIHLLIITVVTGKPVPLFSVRRTHFPSILLVLTDGLRCIIRKGSKGFPRVESLSNPSELCVLGHILTPEYSHSSIFHPLAAGATYDYELENV